MLNFCRHYSEKGTIGNSEKEAVMYSELYEEALERYYQRLDEARKEQEAKEKEEAKK